MKNKFFVILLLVFFSILVSKEFLPISYEIIVIFASILVFIYLKQTLSQILIDFFSSTKAAIKEDVLTITLQAKNRLSPDTIVKYSAVEHDARNIIISTVDFDVLSELEVTKQLDNIIISPINQTTGLYMEEVIS